MTTQSNIHITLDYFERRMHQAGEHFSAEYVGSIHDTVIMAKCGDSEAFQMIKEEFEYIERELKWLNMDDPVDNYVKIGTLRSKLVVLENLLKFANVDMRQFH